jgi:hypothetical protein
LFKTLIQNAASVGYPSLERATIVCCRWCRVVVVVSCLVFYCLAVADSQPWFCLWPL